MVPELLAPAGNLEKLKIAISYGANAVYVAGKKYSLRAGADNLSNIELEEGVRFAHARNAVVYVVLNGFLHDGDLEGLPEYIQLLDRIGVDAVIVSDLGVIDTIQQVSQIPIHLSTQASCLNEYAAKVWKAMGVKRIIVGRETSIEEAASIKKNVGIEVEMFIHGSMCMAYSGHCVISNYTAGRDSNRGGCVQSCRFSYSMMDEAYEDQNNPSYEPNAQSFMSSKDLEGLHLLPQFIEHQIDSIKIEGRMKSNLYVASTVTAYANVLRNLVQSSTTPDYEQGKQTLHSVPHRPYTEASLQTPADATSIFQDPGRHDANIPFDIAGTLLEVCEPDSITMLVQNPISTKSHIELLNFEGSLQRLDTEKLQDIHGNRIDEAKSNTVVKLPYLSNAQPLNLVRRHLQA